MEQKFPIKKVSIICAKGSIEDVYATLIMGNGAVMEGIETNLFLHLLRNGCNNEKKNG